jgi:hypothetical protein
MNRTSSVRKQNSSGHFSPKSPDCQPDGSGSLIRIEQNLVRAVSWLLTTECTLTNQETFGIKSQKEGGSGPPRAVTPWKKKKNCEGEVYNMAYFSDYVLVFLPDGQIKQPKHVAEK